MGKISGLTIAMLLFLTACNTENGDLGNEQSTGSESGTIEIVIDDELEEVMKNVSNILHSTHQAGTFSNEFSLVDLTTGEIVASYDLGEMYLFGGVWDLENGYYAAHVVSINHEAARIVIFNEQLEVIETLFYDDGEVSALWMGFLQVVEGELIAYVLEAGPDNLSSTIVNPVRFNLHIGEIEILAEIDEQIHIMHQFVDENQIFVTDFIADFHAGSVLSRYGILDLETGETHIFEKENFWYGHLDFRDAQVLITESPSSSFALHHEVILFDVYSMSSHIIQLEEEESIWAHFSFDGSHLVTVNEAASLFRMYDLNGILVNEMEIEIPLTVSGAEMFTVEELERMHLSNSFEIFPIAEGSYVIYTRLALSGPGVFLEDHQIQFVTLT